MQNLLLLHPLLTLQTALNMLARVGLEGKDSLFPGNFPLVSNDGCRWRALFVTHDMREANRLADRVLTLRSDPAGAVVEGISLPTAPAG